VLHDIASKVLQGKPIDVSLGNVNFSGGGCIFASAALSGRCDARPRQSMSSGHEILAVRDLAAKFGARFGRAPVSRQGRADGMVTDTSEPSIVWSADRRTDG
jgi:hypothetical protein